MGWWGGMALRFTRMGTLCPYSVRDRNCSASIRHRTFRIAGRCIAGVVPFLQPALKRAGETGASWPYPYGWQDRAGSWSSRDMGLPPPATPLAPDRPGTMGRWRLGSGARWVAQPARSCAAPAGFSPPAERSPAMRWGWPCARGWGAPAATARPAQRPPGPDMGG